MADNVTLNAGSGGVTAASDDVGGVHFQRTKLALGADGVHDGDVSTTNPMPIVGGYREISGTITAANTAYSNNGYTGSSAPAGSYIDVESNGAKSMSIHLSGNGNPSYIHVSLDGITFFPLSTAPFLLSSTNSQSAISTYASTLYSAGTSFYIGNLPPVKVIRITNNNSYNVPITVKAILSYTVYDQSKGAGTYSYITNTPNVYLTPTGIYNDGSIQVGNSGSTLVNSVVIRSTETKLHSLIITNTSGSAQFIQLHNTTTLPADGATPFAITYIPANSTIKFPMNDCYGIALSTGCVVCNSSTAATKTIGSADCFFSYSYNYT